MRCGSGVQGSLNASDLLMCGADAVWVGVVRLRCCCGPWRT